MKRLEFGRHQAEWSAFLISVARVTPHSAKCGVT